MGALPWWVRWLLLPVLILIVAGWAIAWIIGMVLHVLFYIVLAVVVLGALAILARKATSKLSRGRR
jgi:hypothetical protein